MTERIMYTIMFLQMFYTAGTVFTSGDTSLIFLGAWGSQVFLLLVIIILAMCEEDGNYDT